MTGNGTMAGRDDRGRNDDRSGTMTGSGNDDRSGTIARSRT